MSEQDGTARFEGLNLLHAPSWVLRSLSVFAALSLTLLAVSHWNPWRLLVLDDHRLLFTVIGLLGATALDLALWLTPRRGWVRQLTLSLLTIALGLIGWLLLLVVPVVVGDHKRVDRIGSVHDGSVHTVHSSFFMSGCYQFEVRDESGWFTRHRKVGVCLDDERGQPTSSTDGNRLTVTVSDETCEYEVDAPALQVEPVDPKCDVLRSPPDR